MAGLNKYTKTQAIRTMCVSPCSPAATHLWPSQVDTKATPPRSIWVHPYEDEQYIKEHPNSQEKPAAPEYARRHSWNGPTTSTPPNKRGLFARIKDKAIGTKEEREAERQRMALVITHFYVLGSSTDTLSAA